MQIHHTRCTTDETMPRQCSFMVGNYSFRISILRVFVRHYPLEHHYTSVIKRKISGITKRYIDAVSILQNFTLH